MEEFEQKFEASMNVIRVALDGLRSLENNPPRLLFPIVNTEGENGRTE